MVPPLGSSCRHVLLQLLRVDVPQQFEDGMMSSFLAKLHIAEQTKRKAAKVVEFRTLTLAAQYARVALVAEATGHAGARKQRGMGHAALTAQSFLDLPSVSNVVEVIMRLAGNLLAIVKSLPGDGFVGDVSVSEETAMEIEAIGAEFARQSAALYTVLKSNRLANDPKAPFLRTLLLRLNFNGVFFDDAAKTSGGAGAEDKTPGGSLAPSVRSSVASMKSLRSGWGEPIPPMPSLTLKR